MRMSTSRVRVAVTALAVSATALFTGAGGARAATPIGLAQTSQECNAKCHPHGGLLSRTMVTRVRDTFAC